MEVKVEALTEGHPMSRHRGSGIFPSAWLEAKGGNFADKPIVRQAACLEVAERLDSGRHEGHEAFRRDFTDHAHK